MYHESVSKLINQHFSDHPGELTEIWFPVRREDASNQLETFLQERLNCFGIYEDALVEGKNLKLFVFNKNNNHLISTSTLVLMRANSEK